jgi:uncharacterized caspase-like protein
VKALLLSAVLFAILAWTPRAYATPVRILVAASAKNGLSGDRPLSYPNDDAAGVRDVLSSMGGVQADATIFLPDVTKAALLAALDHVESIARQHAPDEVTVIVYFSGHGDRDALHIGGESLPTSDLSSRLSAIPAALRIVVVDACRTTDASRAKGMTVGPGFGVSLSAQSATKGTAWLYASADGEAAQESDEIGGAIFTHFWLAGLRGAADLNGDGRITLDESFEYAYSQTLLRSARSGGVLQRPQARLDLTESSPFVFTELGGERAQLEFPRDSEALYLVYGVGSQSVVAEVYGLPDRAVRIVLPKGRYIIQKRVGTRGAAVDVVLGGGSTHVLGADDFRSFHAEELAQKGGMVVHPWSVEAGDSVMTGREVDIGDELSIRFARRETWGYAIGPLVGVGTWRTPFNGVTELYVGGEASVNRFFTLSTSLLFHMGVDLRGEWVSQSVRRNDADRAMLAGFAATTHNSGTGLGGGLHAGLRFAVAHQLYIDVGARALVLALGARTSSGVDVRVLGGGFVGVGLSL